MSYIPVVQRKVSPISGYIPVAQRQLIQSVPVGVNPLGIDTFGSTALTTPQTTEVGTGEILKIFGQALGRQYLATGQAIVSGSPKTPFVQEPKTTLLGKFTQALTGTDKPISAEEEDVAFIGENIGRQVGGKLTLGLSVLDLYTGGGVKGLKGLTIALKEVSTIEKAAKLMKEAGFADDIIKNYAPIFAKSTDAKQIETGLLKAQELQNSTKAYTPVAERPQVAKTAPKTLETTGVAEQPKSTISPELQPLAQEARKYKSAEEFVKAQPLDYHGTNAEFN